MPQLKANATMGASALAIAVRVFPQAVGRRMPCGATPLLAPALGCGLAALGCGLLLILPVEAVLVGCRRAPAVRQQPELSDSAHVSVPDRSKQPFPPVRPEGARAREPGLATMLPSAQARVPRSACWRSTTGATRR